MILGVLSGGGIGLLMAYVGFNEDLITWLKWQVFFAAGAGENFCNGLIGFDGGDADLAQEAIAAVNEHLGIGEESISVAEVEDDKIPFLINRQDASLKAFTGNLSLVG